MLWPALAGAVSFWLATRDSVPHRLRTGLAAACATGVITGAIAFVGTSIVVYVSLHTFAAPAVKQTGVPTGFITSVSLLALASLALIDVVVAAIGGVLMLPVRYFQTRHAHA